mgnify:CR=1 FL=1
MTSADKSHKTLQYMIDHFNNIRLISPILFYSSLNDLILLANSKADDDILSNYDKTIHTPQFFVNVLDALGYDKNGEEKGE